MKKNKDGTISMDLDEARGTCFRCEQPGYLITEHEFYILSHDDSAMVAKLGDTFWKMFLGFCLQLLVSFILVTWKNDISYNRMDLFQLISMILCILIYLGCKGYIELKGTQRTRIINKIEKIFQYNDAGK